MGRGGIAGLTHQLSRSVGIYAYAGYDRLVSDAADSPIVRAYGSRDQFSGDDQVACVTLYGKW